jgi:hypothetical protein
MKRAANCDMACGNCLVINLHQQRAHAACSSSSHCSCHNQRVTHLQLTVRMTCQYAAAFRPFAPVKTTSARHLGMQHRLSCNSFDVSIAPQAGHRKRKQQAWAGCQN